MFKTVRKVQFSELLEDGRTGLCTLLDYFQDAATEHTEATGYGITRLRREGLAWILRTMNVTVDRYPSFGEQLEIATWTTGFDRIFGNRSFEVLDSEGKRVAAAASHWAFVNMTDGKPVRIIDEVARLYGEDQRFVAEYKRNGPELIECTFSGEYRVLKRDIDTNGHVNNVKYIEIASEYLPEGAKPKGMQVIYRRSAYYGDILKVHTCKMEDSFGVRLKAPSGEDHTAIKFFI